VDFCRVVAEENTLPSSNVVLDCISETFSFFSLLASSLCVLVGCQVVAATYRHRYVWLRRFFAFSFFLSMY
jgi:hypothetical protein